MNKLILSFVAALAAVSSLQAHCGSCGVGGDAEHAASCENCPAEQLEGYYSTQKGLANDDLAAAKKGADAFLAHAETMECNSGEDSCCSTEMDAASTISGASDIAAARVAFKDWSDALLGKLEKSGLGEGVAYKMHCPMAFNNTGADWIQGSKDLRNPYYGSMMLTCGFVSETISAKDASGCSCPKGECSCDSCDGESCKMPASKEGSHSMHH